MVMWRCTSGGPVASVQKIQRKPGKTSVFMTGGNEAKVQQLWPHWLVDLGYPSFLYDWAKAIFHFCLEASVLRRYSDSVCNQGVETMYPSERLCRCQRRNIVRRASSDSSGNDSSTNPSS